MTQISDQFPIWIEGVTKVFEVGPWKKRTAVSDLTLSIPKGQIVGLLGANGSGKSTTMKMILGFLRPNTGSIKVCGETAGTIRSRRLIGYLPENPKFQRFLTADTALQYFGKLLGLSRAERDRRVDQLLQLVNLNHARKDRVSGYSKGMTQRLAIAQSLYTEPPLLIFDEPMSGLDPLGRMEIRRLITRIREEMPHTTLVFSSHVLADVEELCSSVAVMKKGKLQAHCNIEELISREANRYQLTVTSADESSSQKLREKYAARSTPLGLSFFIDGTEKLMDGLAELERLGGSLVNLTSQRHRLEQALFAEPDAKSKT